MPVEVHLQGRGLAELHQLGAALKAAPRELKRELPRAMKQVALPMAREVKTTGAGRLPKRGGLAAYIASARITIKTRTTGRQAGVRIEGGKTKTGGKVDLPHIDAGALRHPVRQRSVEKAAGRKPLWVSQSVEPGFWSEPTEHAAPHLREQVLAVIDTLLAKIKAGG
jgi:hypothetical protein